MIKGWRKPDDTAEPAPRSPWRKWIALTLSIIAFGAFLWWLHAKNSSGGDKRPQAPIAVTQAARKDVPVYFNGLGTVQAFNTVTVHSQIDGQLSAVLFHEGETVHVGQVLAKIDPRTYQAQLDQAIATKAKDEATLANAQVDLQRYENLGTSISNQMLETQRALVKQLEATVKADQAAIDNARTLLSYTVITSLIDGRTGIRQLDAGNIIHASDANGLVVVTQLQPISVIFSLPQQNLQSINLQLNQQTDKLKIIAVAADGKTPLEQGELELVDNEIDQSTGTIKLKATFPNTDQMLWPGAFINVRLLLNTRQNVLTVPTVAVQLGPQGSYVFIYKPENKTVEIRPVKVSMSEGLDSVIDDGVQDGESVVTDGMAKLQNGSKVTLATAPETSATDASKPADPAQNNAENNPDQKKHRHKQDSE